MIRIASVGSSVPRSVMTSRSVLPSTNSMMMYGTRTSAPPLSVTESSPWS